jgi:hypothetical protein
MARNGKIVSCTPGTSNHGTTDLSGTDSEGPELRDLTTEDFQRKRLKRRGDGANDDRVPRRDSALAVKCS